MFKKFLSAITLFMSLWIPAAAQQPQTHDIPPTEPPFATNSNWVNGVAPGYWPTALATTGLILNVGPGTSFFNTTIQFYNGTPNLTMTDNTTNYVSINEATGIPGTSTSNFASGQFPLAIVVTSGGNITSIIDVRNMYSNSVSSAATSGLQMGYTQQGSGQYVLVYFTQDSCGATVGGAASCNNTSYAITISGGQNGSASFSVPQLPAGITAAQITGIYPFAFKYQLNAIGGGNPTESGPLTFSGTGLGGCALSRGGSSPTATPLQYGCQLTGTLANFSTITAAMGGSTNVFQGGGTLGSTLVGMEIDYSGTPVTQPATVNCGPGLYCNASTIDLFDYSIYPLTLKALESLPTQPNDTYNLVLDATSATGPCSGAGGGAYPVWCVADGSGGYSAVAFGGGSTIQLTGDATAGPGSGSLAVSVVKVNGGAIPASQPCVGTNSSSQFTDGSCGGGSTAPSVSFTILNGSASTPAAPYLNASATGTISNCYFTTLTADSGTNLVFVVKLAGTSIISGGSATVAAGTSPATVSTFALTSGTIAVTQGNQWELDITGGTSSWTGAIQCY